MDTRSAHRVETQKLRNAAFEDWWGKFRIEHGRLPSAEECAAARVEIRKQIPKYAKRTKGAKTP